MSEAPLRVLHVITRLELGGAQHNTLYTVAHLDRRGFAPALAWGPGDRLDGAAEALADVRRYPIPQLVREVRPLGDLRALAALRGVMRCERPDIVHTHSSKAGILGRLAAHLEGVPVIVHSVHGFGFTPLQAPPVRAAFLALERLAGRCTQHVIVVAERHRREGAALGLFPAERCSVVRSGIALDAAPDPAAVARARAELGGSADAPLVGQVGNFKAQKAPLDFVRMAAAVRREVPRARFVMVGDGPQRARAEALARRLGLGGAVTFTGWREDVPALLAACRVAVLTSRHEGLPRAAVEALARGVPVVATDVDGTGEVVRHGVNGLLAPPGDVAALAAGVVRLLTDPELHARLAAAAPADLADFDIDRMVRRQEELYRWLWCQKPS